MPPKTFINICSDIDAVILCGGRGMRLRPVVNDRPKVMAKIDSQPFLDLLIAYLRGFGFKRFILCIGYKGSFIKDYYIKKIKNSGTIVFSSEKSPMGTGGALKKARKLIQSNPFLVLNGDSFIRADIQKFIKSHSDRDAHISVILKKSSSTKDYGSVDIDSASRIIDFQEKNKAGKPAYINCGIYLCGQEIFDLMPKSKKFSLERDFFPKMTKGGFYGHVVNSAFIDIGTPEKYNKAKRSRLNFSAYHI